MHLVELLEARRLLVASPVAFYTFEEGSGGTAADSSGHGHTGALQGGTAFGEGLIARYSISFDGTGYVEVPNAALLTFNLGVELGQLAVIVLAFAAVGWWRRQSWYRRRIVLPASSAIAAVALVWTLQRVWGAA